MARSTKGSSNRPATAGATTLPPAPKLAAIVTVPTQMLRYRSWHLRSVAANGWAGWVLDLSPEGSPQPFAQSSLPREVGGVPGEAGGGGTAGPVGSWILSQEGSPQPF